MPVPRDRNPYERGPSLDDIKEIKNDIDKIGDIVSDLKDQLIDVRVDLAPKIQLIDHNTTAIRELREYTNSKFHYMEKDAREYREKVSEEIDKIKGNLKYFMGALAVAVIVLNRALDYFTKHP